MTTISRKSFKRAEIAYLINATTRRVATLCSPSKRTLIPDINEPDLIDLTIEKNYRYVSERLVRDESDLVNMPKPKVPVKKEEKKPVVKKKLTTPPKKKVEPKKKRGRPKKVSEVVEKVIEKPTVSKQAEVMNELDQIKMNKLKTEMELKQLDLQQKKGDLISAKEVVPFVTKLTKRRDDLMKTETISLMKDMVVEYQLESTFLGRFEREFIELMNKTNAIAVGEFMEDVGNE